MGQLPGENTLALDDGIPYYPTITEIAESPLRPGLLYVGTDDGNLQVTQDDGKHWANLTKRFPGLPETMWVSGIEASRHNAGTAYVSFDGHRSNDFANYLYRSTDFGNTMVVSDRRSAGESRDPRGARGSEESEPDLPSGPSTACTSRQTAVSIGSPWRAISRGCRSTIS